MRTPFAYIPSWVPARLARYGHVTGHITRQVNQHADRYLPVYLDSTEALTPRELELIDGMIEVQLHHAAQCDGIANRVMAEKQKGWDMERVTLLRKLRAQSTPQPADPSAPTP
jgi:hypothetical protein